MTLDELMHLQQEFDSKHKSKFPWNCEITDDNLEMLEFLLVSLLGELGEVSNIVKKVVRGDFLLEDKKAEIAEEMADMFIYMMKLSYQMGIDLESACLEKIKKNQERFEHYEKNTDEEK